MFMLGEITYAISTKFLFSAALNSGKNFQTALFIKSYSRTMQGFFYISNLVSLNLLSAILEKCWIIFQTMQVPSVLHQGTSTFYSS